MHSSTSSQGAEWPAVVDRFLEHRGHGSVLSSMDLKTLESWREQGLRPEAVIAAMDELWQRCCARGTNFPMTLRSLELRLKKMKAAQIGGDHDLST